MSTRRLHAAVMAVVVTGVLMTQPPAVASAVGQSKSPAPLGQELFRTYCASCHGTSAKGDGPMASRLRDRPADLTAIAKRNGGAFPADKVASTIDGRSPVKGHGGPDMPMWGDYFAKSTGDATAGDQKIQLLVRYLESVQVKP